MRFFLGVCICAASAGPSFAQVLRVHVLDVGYADALLVELPSGAAYLVDAGEPESAESLLDYFAGLEITHLPAVILTHPHVNHFGGLQAVADKISIGRVFINGDPNAEEGYGELLEYLQGKKIPVDELRSGDELPGTPDDIVWRVLHPDSLDADVNGNSIVSLIRFRETTVLLTADIMVPAQEKIIQQYPELRYTQLVQIPHHGGPLTEGFFSFFEDSRFFLSTGENPWGLPDEAALADVPGRIFRTDTDGTILVESDGEEIRIIATGHGRN